ncbi:MAG: molybdopterin-dependent oxidoreductase [Desulfohalobiaceae bacterium]
MVQRRQILGTALRVSAAAAAVACLGGLPAAALAENASKRVLSADTDTSSLLYADPENLDTSNLEIMPLREFGTMGDTDIALDQGDWRLAVTGKVERELELTYSELRDLPAMEREVLLICPGVFANHGRWRGVSLKELIRLSRPSDDASRVAIHGRSSSGTQTDSFDIEEASADKVFLAYRVNGQKLPQKHGFPLRVVAEDHLGYNWTKYVVRVEFL